MPANITASVKLVNSATTLPAGRYEGTWSGYAVCSDDERWPTDYYLETEVGIRGWANVVITVADGVALVEE